MGRKIRVGSRDSKLAVAQSNLILDAVRRNHPKIEFELVTMKTQGDLILDKRLDKIGGKGLFVKELDQALLDGRVDITIHSLKDLPMKIDNDIPLVAFPQRGNPFDVMIFGKNLRKEECFASELKVGTSSMRRELQLRKLYEGIRVESVRGNLQTRLAKLDDGKYSAILLAYAGLKRLGLDDELRDRMKIFSADEIVPAAGQGILAVQGRAGENYDFLECIKDDIAYAAAKAERGFVKALDGGCTSPIGGYAEILGNELRFYGFYANEKTGEEIYKVVLGEAKDAEKIAQKLAEEFKKSIG